MIGSEYFLHAYGPIYALSKEVVANLAANKNQRYGIFSISFGCVVETYLKYLLYVEHVH